VRFERSSRRRPGKAGPASPSVERIRDHSSPDAEQRVPDTGGIAIRAALLVLAGTLAYANALSGPFLFDDDNSIVHNAQIRQLWPLSVPLSPPRDTPVAGRPLVNLTFAANYAVGELDVRGYRLVNLGVHLLAALVLFGLVRRTLRLPLLAGRLGPHSLNLAWASAFIWMLHPLNTETVNYLSQRTESLMGLFYLLTLYCSVRAYESGAEGRRAGWAGNPALQMAESGRSAGEPKRAGRATKRTREMTARGEHADGRRSRGWTLAAIVCCAMGMASKESMVTVPVVVALYDRAFIFPSLRAAFRSRGLLYAGLSAAWLVLAVLMSSVPRTSIGFDAGTSTWVYFLNQMEIIPRYLWLAVWPRALVLDYGLPRPLTLADVAVPAVFLVAAGLAAVAVLLWRPFVGFAAAWFFITLAPTSSFVPIATEVGAERRMYLPLAGLVVLAVVGVFAMAQRFGVRHVRAPEGRASPWYARPALRGALVGGAVCALLAVGTYQRNREYESRFSMARTIAERRPHGRAHFIMGSELVAAGRESEAIEHFQRSAVDYPGAHFGLATELISAGKLDEGIHHAREFIRLLPDHPAVAAARDMLARALAVHGETDAAEEQFMLLLEAVPRHTAANTYLGDRRLQQERYEEAIGYYQSALLQIPGDPEVLRKLGLALAVSGRVGESIDAFQRALASDPDNPVLRSQFGRALASAGRYEEAIVQFRRVLELVPGDAQAHRDLTLAEDLVRRAEQN
jgi:protein O-mannosyl-transferase